jgi:hypothetical protein
MPDFIKSPRQATTVFGLDGQSVPRKKSLFYVRFRRADNAQAGRAGWQDNLGFMAKSVDRPSVQPQIEELNQYGKKRQVTTGIKNQPARIVLYDTADSMAMRMWVEYSRWYFGEYRQDSDAMWDYDVTTEEMYGMDEGFGFTLRNSSSDAIDLNSQFFFDALEVYQVWGGYFTQFDLINPKISAFDPDELDYSVTEPSTISVTLNYEAMIHQNGAAPQPISSDPLVASVFGGLFNGNTFDPEGAASSKPRHGYNFTDKDVAPAPLSFRNKTLGQIVDSALHTATGSQGVGSLGIFGNFNFGAATGVNTGSLAGDISYLATGNPALASVLNQTVGQAATSASSRILSTGSSNVVSGYSSSKVDTAKSALLGAATNVSNKYANQYVNNNLLGGVVAAGVIEGTPATDQVSKTSSGLSLKSMALAVINSNRAPVSQIGFNQVTQLTPVVADSNPAGFLPAGVPDVNFDED